MSSTNYWPRLTANPTGADDRFEELRIAYYARLKSDRAQIFALRAQLLKAPEDKPTYDAIRVAAHGMAGAAAIFEAADIMKAARKLEQATSEAAQGAGASGNPSVHPLLDSLIELLDSICN